MVAFDRKNELKINLLQQEHHQKLYDAVSKCFLSLFRPSFEVVEEGRILNDIKQVRPNLFRLHFIHQSSLGYIWLLLGQFPLMANERLGPR